MQVLYSKNAAFVVGDLIAGFFEYTSLQVLTAQDIQARYLRYQLYHLFLIDGVPAT